MAGIRPLTRTVVVAVVAVVTAGLGVGVASPPAVALGVVLIVSIVIDALRFALFEARRPPPGLIRVIQPNPATVGDQVGVRLMWPRRPANRGNPLSSGTVEEAMPAELVARSQVRPAAARPGRIALEYDVTPTRRGRWPLGPAAVTVESALGLWQTRITDRTSSGLTAWPKTVPMTIRSFVQDREGTAGSAGFLQPDQDNATIRTYSPGDDLRRVHWRSSARRGELMSRAEEPTDSDRSWVGLVVPETTSFERREMAVSLAASWILATARAGFGVELAAGDRVVHGTVAALLTELAGLKNDEAGRALPAATPEGLALIVVARPVRPESLPRPPRGIAVRTGGAYALVLSDHQSDADLLSARGWVAVRVDSAEGLEAAAARLARTVDRPRGARVVT